MSGDSVGVNTSGDVVEVRTNKGNHDERYYTEGEVDALILTRAPANHDHDADYAAIDHNHDGTYAAEGHTHVHNHDADYAAIDHNHDTEYYTQAQVDTALAGKSDTTHRHDADYYTQTQVDNALALKSDTTHDHDTEYYLQPQVDAALALKSDTTHNHDERYFTETEVQTRLDGKAATVHAHDDLYYPRADVDAALALKSDTTHNHDTEYADINHDHAGVYDPAGTGASEAASAVTAHEAALDPHSQYLTAPEGNGLYASISHDHDADYAATVHTHDDRYFTESEVNDALALKADVTHNHDSAYANITHNHDGDYDPAGAATAAITAHEGALDPHPGYATDAEVSTQLASKLEVTDLVQGTNVTLDKVGNQVTINATGGVGGVTDHALLDNREATDSHPTSAITGLDAALASKLEVTDLVAGTNVTLDKVGNQVTVNSSAAGGGVTDHGALTGLTDADHPIGAVQGLQTALDGKASTVHTHTTSQVDGLDAALATKLEVTDLVQGTNVTLDKVGNQVTINATGGGATTLGGLTDVELAGLADGDVIQWDAGAGDWVPVDPAPTVETIPAGSTLTVFESGGAYPARPTARTDVTVVWVGSTDPVAVAVDGVDAWDQI